MSNLAPSENKIQIESVKYNQPVGFSSEGSIGSLSNALFEIICPIATVVPSMLTEAQFQTENGNPSPEKWVLADGRSVVGSAYEALGLGSTIPDLRGVYIRGKNNGRSGSTGNPDGDLALGTYQSDQFQSHSHPFTDTSNNPKSIIHNNDQGTIEAGFAVAVRGYDDSVNFSNQFEVFITNSGFGTENIGRTVTINHFIRIN